MERTASQTKNLYEDPCLVEQKVLQNITAKKSDHKSSVAQCSTEIDSNWTLICSKHIEWWMQSEYSQHLCEFFF